MATNKIFTNWLVTFAIAVFVFAVFIPRPNRAFYNRLFGPRLVWTLASTLIFPVKE